MDLETIPGTLCERQEYSLDGIYTCFGGGEGKQENLEETQMKLPIVENQTMDTGAVRQQHYPLCHLV